MHFSTFFLLLLLLPAIHFRNLQFHHFVYFALFLWTYWSSFDPAGQRIPTTVRCRICRVARLFSAHCQRHGKMELVSHRALPPGRHMWSVSLFLLFSHFRTIIPVIHYASSTHSLIPFLRPITLHENNSHSSVGTMMNFGGQMFIHGSSFGCLA